MDSEDFGVGLLCGIILMVIVVSAVNVTSRHVVTEEIIDEAKVSCAENEGLNYIDYNLFMNDVAKCNNGAVFELGVLRSITEMCSE